MTLVVWAFVSLYLIVSTMDAPHSNQVGADVDRNDTIKNKRPTFSAQVDNDGIIGQKTQPLHPSLLIEDVGTLIKATNSSDYRWVGKHFVPPPGVPMFTPAQVKSYFQTRNVLVIGDSTSRRFFNTLHAMCTAEDLGDVTEKELNDEDIIDRNKKEQAELCTLESNRALFPNKVGGLKWSECRELNATSDNSIVTEDLFVNRNTIEVSSIRKKMRFDHTTQYHYHETSWFWRDDSPTDPNAQVAAMHHDYDLVIIVHGVWEFKINDSTANSTMTSRMEDMLNNIKKNNPQDIQVVFRTSGLDQRFQDGRDQKVWDTYPASNQFFRDLYDSKDHANMTLVDWGSVIGKRSYGEKWIAGDMAAHYGLEGRLLFIQQLMHELVKADLLVAERNLAKNKL